MARLIRAIRARSGRVVASAAVLTAAAASMAQGNPAFRSLGDLSGGVFFSQALAVSADGSVVVGVAT